MWLRYKVFGFILVLKIVFCTVLYFIETMEDADKWTWKTVWKRSTIRLLCCWPRLMLAASAGKMSPVQELRRLGASYEVTDAGGSTALHWACLSKNPMLVDWMLQDGADVSVTNDQGRTPLLMLGAKTLLFYSQS